MTAFLASVSTPEEALMAAGAGVDLIDLKDPGKGALGALSLEHIRTILDTLEGQTVSATIGDLPLDPDTIVAAVHKVGECGVDFIKIGFFPGGELEGVLEALLPLARRYSLIAVLFADYLIALPLIDSLAGSCFKGVMLDTARKQKGSLPQLRSMDFLQRFVDRARTQGLLTGLAGSLRVEDIPQLLTLGSDYLGFRGALCETGKRTRGLDKNRLAEVRRAIPHQPMADQ